MNRKPALVAALGFLTVLGTAEVAEAKIRVFGFAGNRSQVANACTGPGRSLSEFNDHNGIGVSMCVDSIRNTGVVCDDTGRCIGTHKGRFAGIPRPRSNFVPPESIVESDNYVPPAEPQSMPTPPGKPGDIIY